MEEGNYFVKVDFLFGFGLIIVVSSYDELGKSVRLF